MDAPLTSTQFVAATVGLSEYAPKPDRKGRITYGVNPSCWLCGGKTGGRGWLQCEAIAPTFTQNNLAAVQDSDTVCQACAALTKAETFQASVRRFGLDLKLWVQAGWHCYGHFAATGIYECPKPGRWREILLVPPEPPFVVAINASGQKHTIFRAGVAASRDLFPVHFDDVTFPVDRAAFASVLADFERMTAMGFSKDSVLTGRYHPEAMRQAGIDAWRFGENVIRRHRAQRHLLLGLVHHVARSPTWFRENAPEVIAPRPVRPAPVVKVVPPAPQLSLF